MNYKKAVTEVAAFILSKKIYFEKCDNNHQYSSAFTFIFVKKKNMFSFIKNLLKREKLDYRALLERGAIIIDVRTENEFSRGHADNSINIPLSEISNHIEKIKNKSKPVITCCRSGMRSGSAVSTLRKAGIEAYNGGSWNKVQAGLVI